jgi:hypothetical protein
VELHRIDEPKGVGFLATKAPAGLSTSKDLIRWLDITVVGHNRKRNSSVGM